MSIMDLSRKCWPSFGGARGLPDQPWRACWPDGRVRLHGRSIHKLAQWTVEENAAHGPRLARYKPYGLPRQRGISPKRAALADAGLSKSTAHR